MSDSWPTITIETADLAAVTRVAASVHLLDVRLVSTQALRNVEVPEVPKDWVRSATIGYDGRIASASEGNTRFSVHVLCFAAFDGGEPVTEVQSEEPPDVLVQSIFELDYSIHQGANPFTNEDLANFAFVNGTFNAWPYWRQLAQDLTTRMGLTPLVVPVFRVPNRAAQADEAVLPARQESHLSEQGAGGS